MLILLPPSETKTTPEKGKPLSLSSLSISGLKSERATVIDALVALCASQPKKAVTALGITARQLDEVTRNAQLLKAPTATALEVYTGVLYDAIGLDSLTSAQRARIEETVVIQSALFGIVAAGDRIPAYRLSADSTLPKLGTMSAWWAKRLQSSMEALIGSRPVLDLRSGAYAAMWKPSGDIAGQVVVGKVLLETKGVRKVVSHHNKATKGRLVRELSKKAAPKTIEGIAAACEKAGVVVELHEPKKAGQPYSMDLVVREL